MLRFFASNTNKISASNSKHLFFNSALQSRGSTQTANFHDDANDVTHLQHDPLFKDVLQSDLASQPTISRFENSMDRHSIFDFCNAWVDYYVSSLQGRKRIVIDVDATDDPSTNGLGNWY